VLGFEGAGARQVGIVGLGGPKYRQLDAELVEMQGGDGTAVGRLWTAGDGDRRLSIGIVGA
jgi:hypothetical protein